MSNLTCFQISAEAVECNGTIYEIPEAKDLCNRSLPENKLTPHDREFWVYLAIYVGLVLFAGLMSGLTMGLLSLDVLTLKVMRDGGTASEKKHALKILPIIQRHHLLLVTLLLGNAAAVEAMPIFLDRISDPVIAILVSVTAVLIFGEVIPQAICTRFGLAIGASLAPLVYLLMGLFFVVAWPISKLLDCLLGKDHSTFFRRAELKVLVDLHGSNTGELHGNQEHLTSDEVVIIKGALDMKNKTVKDAMVPIDNVYMLDINRCMDSSTMTEMLETSHSRVPVYEGSRDNIISLLLVKTLIHLDPDDATPVRSLVDSGMARPVLHTSEDRPLFDLLNEFQEGKGHLAVVRCFRGHPLSISHHVQNLDDNTPLLGHDSDDEDILDITERTTGIITLEDVLEELIQEEILDETDVYEDLRRQLQVARAKAAKRLNTQTSSRRRLDRSTSHPPLRPKRQVLSLAPDLVTIEEHNNTDIQNVILA